MLLLQLASRSGRSPASIVQEWSAEEWDRLKLYQLLSPPIETRFDILMARLTAWVAAGAGVGNSTTDDYLPEWGKGLLNGGEKHPTEGMNDQELAAYIEGRSRANLLLLNPGVVAVSDTLAVEDTLCPTLA